MSNIINTINRTGRHGNDGLSPELARAFAGEHENNMLQEIANAFAEKLGNHQFIIQEEQDGRFIFKEDDFVVETAKRLSDMFNVSVIFEGGAPETTIEYQSSSSLDVTISSTRDTPVHRTINRIRADYPN